MEEEKREGQKTVVAFISGLLIGGLLMWVFGAQPKKNLPVDVKVDDTKTTDTPATTNGATPPTTTEVKTETVKPTSTSMTKPEVIAGVGSLSSANQKAGMKVSVSDIKYPANTGWITVQNFVGDKLGTTLGAARFDVKAGLMPKDISLIVPTVAGKEYKVVFHSSDGDRAYASATDKVMVGADGKPLASTFKAE